MSSAACTHEILTERAQLSKHATLLEKRMIYLRLAQLLTWQQSERPVQHHCQQSISSRPLVSCGSGASNLCCGDYERGHLAPWTPSIYFLWPFYSCIQPGSVGEVECRERGRGGEREVTCSRCMASVRSKASLTTSATSGCPKCKLTRKASIYTCTRNLSHSYLVVSHQQDRCYRQNVRRC